MYRQTIIFLIFRWLLRSSKSGKFHPVFPTGRMRRWESTKLTHVSVWLIFLVCFLCFLSFLVRREGGGRSNWFHFLNSFSFHKICVLKLFCCCCCCLQGYTIPLDKRLAADGRGLQDPHINDKFAKLAEALYIADRKVNKEFLMCHHWFNSVNSFHGLLHEWR